MANTNFFKSIFSSQVKPPEKFSNDTYFYPVAVSALDFGGQNPVTEFCEIPELNAIINIRANAEASWKLKVLSKQTGKEQQNQQSLVRILKSPNWFQGAGEFWKQSSIFRSVWGNEYLYFLTPFGMPNTYKGLFTLDPGRVKVTYKSDSPYFLDDTGDGVKYEYKVNDNTWIPLERKNIIHLNDNRITSGPKFLKGTSKIDALAGPLANIREAYKKRNIILKMPIGIMSNGQSDAVGQAVPLDDKEKEATKVAINTRGASAIITNLAVKYSEMNIDARKMGLFEEVAEDTGRICDAYGVPYKLLAQLKGNVLNSSGTELRESRKQMYEESIIPSGEEKADALNLKLETETKAWEVKPQYNHLPVFQTDIKARAETLQILVSALDTAFASRAITIEQYENELKKMGL